MHTHRFRPRHLAALLLLAATASVRPPAAAQTDSTAPPRDTTSPAASSPAPAPAPVEPPATQPPGAGASPAGADTLPPRVLRIDTARARMGDRIRIYTAKVQPTLKPGDRLVLFLDGRAMDSVFARPVGPGGEVWEVRLRRTASKRDEWEPVLGQPRRERRVLVGLGPAAGPELPAVSDTSRTLALQIVSLPWLVGFVVAWCILLAWMWTLARNKGLLRDAPPRPSPADGTAAGEPGADPPRPATVEDRPYSLARAQAAFWFVLVTTAFVAIWLITGDYHGVMTEQALLLMGIASLTTLGAVTVEKGKIQQIARADNRQALVREQEHLQAEEARLARESAGTAQDRNVASDLRAAMAANARRLANTDSAQAPSTPPHSRFWDDILQVDGAVSMARLQVVVWTLLLGAVFVREVWASLSLPAFDGSLLALLVVSGGLYVFSKGGEDQV